MQLRSQNFLMALVTTFPIMETDGIVSLTVVIFRRGGSRAPKTVTPDLDIDSFTQLDICVIS